MFVDASALTAIIVGESDADALTRRLEVAAERLISGISLWETAMAVARIKKSSPADGWAEVERYVVSFGLRVVAISTPEAKRAIDVQAQYGRGTGGGARLNMGDCFAYACAQANNVRLLYKGDDFAKTDLA